MNEHVEPPKGTVRSRRTEVQELLDRLARAVTAGDGAAAAKLWEAPAVVVGDDMVHSIATGDELASFFAGAKQSYKARGITDTRAEITRLEWVTEKLVLVDVRWPYLDEAGREMGEESAMYTLRRGDDGELRVRVATMHGASAPH
jgi:hypothetical protein